MDQVSSVGPGQVLADVIGAGTVPVIRLIEVFRQARLCCTDPPDGAENRASVGGFPLT